VVVVPARGLLFWHEVNYENSTESIMRAWLDGTEATAVVSLAVSRLEEDQQQQPAISNLTYSPRTDRLYWLQRGGRLRFYNLMTAHQGDQLELPLGNVTALAEHNGTLYLGQQAGPATWTLGAILLEGAAESAAAVRIIRNITHPVLSLAVYDPESQLEKNKCSVNNGGCAHLCVPVREGRFGHRS
jgi:hypothetical protein